MKQKLQNLRLPWFALLCISISFSAQAEVITPPYSTGPPHPQTSLEKYRISETGLKIQYTFDSVTNKTVADASGSGYNATLMNNASILSMGKYKVLDLGNGTGYLDMGTAVGNVLSSTTNYTVSVYYRVDKNASLSGNGFFLWAFSVLTANNANAGPYLAYRLNAQRFALSTGGYNHEKTIEIGGAATKATWQHILYRQSGTQGELYLNGKLVGTNTAIPIPNTIFTTATPYNWIGRAPFNGDSYLKNTLVYDFRFYDQAVNDEQITEWATLVNDLNYEYAYGTVGDFTQLSQQITQYNALLTPEQTGNYTQVAVEEFKDAIAVAQDMVNAQKASQFTIDDCLATLRSAYNKFKTTEGFQSDDTFITEYNPEKGFKHPGALHTQEDFDRVKALLATNDPTVISAYNKLKANAYSQSNVTTYPTETIVRGGSGENYMNAARGASMAYQNALRWKISGEKAHAERAILILNSWVSICKAVGGDTNQSLASGIYGYEFANAAELMRDYEGWKPADFKKFQEWMLYVWYPRCIDFLRRRHGTWQQGTPGHYWSNWGLCNALAVMSIGILCDDVFIYNQGISFYKRDQVGNFTDNRTPPIDNNGLTEFIGNLIPALYADNRSPYGYIGQMQESGRDQGHALMALGLATDICQIGWNQGDDLFSLMDNRLAAGIEYVAAYNSGTDALPWSEYWYHDVRTAIHNSWKMTGNNESGRGAFRPYWDRIIGHYEGIKGVGMPYSQAMKDKQPIDDGGGSYGQTSGGFDHLGFSTLMCARPAVNSEQAPTTILPTLIYNGVTYHQNELGGLTNKFENAPTTALPAGSIVKFVPQLPAGVTNTGNWMWSTGIASKDLEITANNSSLYRVTYTNDKGVKSTQLYSIAVKEDCMPDLLTPAITVNGMTTNDTILTVMPRTTFTLEAQNPTGWGNYQWNNSATTSGITVTNINSDRTYSVIYTNQGGRKTKLDFHIHVRFMAPSIVVNGDTLVNSNRVVVNPGQSVELIPMVPNGKENGTWNWSNHATTQKLLVENIQHTGHYSVSYIYDEKEYTLDFDIYVPTPNKPFTNGYYHLINASNGKYLTNDGSSMIPSFRNRTGTEIESQTWEITKDGTRYKIVSRLDNRFLNEFGQFTLNPYYTAWNSYTLYGVEDGDLYAIQNGGSSGTDYWAINSNGSLNGKGGTILNGYPFEIIPASLSGTTKASHTEIRVYPNPMQDYLIILQEENNASDALFRLFSADGTIVKSISCTTGENSIQVNDLPRGLYFGIFTINGQEKTVKIIKK